jgi:hypothetical protein
MLTFNKMMGATHGLTLQTVALTPVRAAPAVVQLLLLLLLQR